MMESKAITQSESATFIMNSNMKVTRSDGYSNPTTTHTTRWKNTRDEMIAATHHATWYEHRCKPNKTMVTQLGPLLSDGATSAAYELTIEVQVAPDDTMTQEEGVSEPTRRPYTCAYT
jgi:hypothetical protein